MCWKLIVSSLFENRMPDETDVKVRYNYFRIAIQRGRENDRERDYTTKAEMKKRENYHKTNTFMWMWNVCCERNNPCQTIILRIFLPHRRKWVLWAEWVLLFMGKNYNIYITNDKSVCWPQTSIRRIGWWSLMLSNLTIASTQWCILHQYKNKNTCMWTNLLCIVFGDVVSPFGCSLLII